jgi:hypothetical protein
MWPGEDRRDLKQSYGLRVSSRPEKWLIFRAADLTLYLWEIAAIMFGTLFANVRPLFIRSIFKVTCLLIFYGDLSAPSPAGGRGLGVRGLAKPLL